MKFSEIKLPSNRKFGFFFTFVFALVAIYYYSANATWTYVFIGAAAVGNYVLYKEQQDEALKENYEERYELD